jgi:hypothetical protein
MPLLWSEPTIIGSIKTLPGNNIREIQHSIFSMPNIQPVFWLLIRLKFRSTIIHRREIHIETVIPVENSRNCKCKYKIHLPFLV